jgi:hypothetical protein
VGNGKVLVSLPQWKGTGTRVGSADGLWCGARLCRPGPAVPLPSRNDLQMKIASNLEETQWQLDVYPIVFGKFIDDFFIEIHYW